MSRADWSMVEFDDTLSMTVMWRRTVDDDGHQLYATVVDGRVVRVAVVDEAADSVWTADDAVLAAARADLDALVDQ